MKSGHLFGLLAALILVSACRQQAAPTEAPGDPVFQHPSVQSVSERIGRDPGNARLYFERGLALHRLEADSFAIRDFKKAASLDSSKSEYFSAVGDLMFQHKDVSGSLPWIEKALQLNPNDPNARLKVARVLIFVKEYPKAFSEINTVLRRNAMVPEAYFLKGLIYKDLKDTSKAISSFQTTLQIDPSHRDAMLLLGAVYSWKNDSLALRYYDNAFRQDTSDVFPIYAKGMYFQERQEYEAAKEMYKSAIVNDREYTNAYFNTGFILMQQDSLEKALRQFDLVTRLDPVNAKAYYNRGLCREMMGDNAAALQDYKQALTFNEQYTEAQEAVRRLSK